MNLRHRLALAAATLLVTALGGCGSAALPPAGAAPPAASPAPPAASPSPSAPITDPSQHMTNASWPFQRVSGPTYSVRIRLATPNTVDKLCGQYGVHTQGVYSCRYGQTEMINLRRWLNGVPGFGITLD